jgi:hypothetical protein
MEGTPFGARALRNPSSLWRNQLAGLEGSRVALGQTRAGRYLRVVYVPDPEPDSVFVLTAYDLTWNAKHALRRRRKRKKP